MLLAAVLVLAVLGSALIIDRTRPKLARPAIVSLQHSGRHLRMLLVGDSVAGTLGVGLAQAADAAGVTLINAATGGCSVGVAWDSGWPTAILGPAPTTYPCQNSSQLTGYWRGLLERYRPDVVVYVARVDTVDQKVGTRVRSILDPSFQAYLGNALTQAVGVLSSTGAHVVLATSVPTKMALAGDRSDDPRRWSIYGGILTSVAARAPSTVSLFDLGRFFGGSGPEPTFRLTSPTGVQWRCADGIHISTAGGILVAPELFAKAWSLAGRLAPDRPGTPAIPPGVADQPWPPYEIEHQVMGCPP